MVAAYLEEGSYGAPTSVINLDSVHPTHVVVSDAEFLFTAHFHRAGPDLVLIGRDGHKLIIPGYFASEHRPALIAPNGASLSPDLVDLLAGSPTPNEYAQAGQSTPPEPIGRVEKVVGDVTVVRNGVAVTLNVGDAIYKSDVVQTGEHSSLGIAFPDGTAFNLVANTRMALNEYAYDASSTSNSALFSLVEGGLSFVAGKVAHTGDMKIDTPVASLGIRGTAGWLYEDATVTSQAGTVTLHFGAVFDSVSNTESTYTLYQIDSNGQLQHDAQGNPIALATVTSTNGQVATLQETPTGIQVSNAPADFTQQQFVNNVVPQALNMAIEAIQQYQQNTPTTPQSTSPSGGSGSGGALPSPPPPLLPLSLPINPNNGPTATVTVAVNNSQPSGSTPTLAPQTPQNESTITAPTTTPTTTPLMATPATLVADGTTMTTLTVTADPNATVILTATGTGNTFTSPITGTTNAEGVFMTTLSSTVAQNDTFTALINGTTSVTASVNFTAGAVSQATSSLTATPSTLLANATTLTVTAEDAHGNVIPNAPVTLTATGTGNTFTSPITGTTNAEGVFTHTVESTVAQNDTFTAVINGTASETASVNFTAGAVSQATSSLTATSAMLVADGTTTTLTVTAEDANGNLIPFATVTLTASGTGNTFTSPITGTTNAEGVFTTTLESTVAQSDTFTALIGGTASETASVDFTAGPVSQATSSLIATPAALATGGTTTLTVTAEDANGNLIPDATVILTATGTGNTFTSPITGTTNAEGVFTTTLESTVAQSDTFTALIGGTAGEIATVNFTAVTENVPATLSVPENAALSLGVITVADTPNIGDPLATVLTVGHGTITVGDETGASVTLTGTAAAINAALAGATYTGGTNYNGPDTLTVATTDTTSGTTFSTSAAITVTDTTTVSETVLPITVAENTATLALSNYVTVADTPNIGDPLSTVLTVENGTITVGDETGASVTLTGTAAAINAALAGATYSGTTNYYGPDTLTVATTDTMSGSTISKTAAITVTDNAVITESLTGTLSGTEQAPITLAGLTVTDSNASDATLTTTLTVTDGLITVGDDGTPAATVTLTGTAAAIDAALQTASYTGNAGFYGTDTLTVTTTDGGGATSGAQQFAITVTDNAVITESLTGTLSGTEQAPITLAGLTVTDSNASDATLTTTLTVTDGLITVGDDGTPAATVTLTGTAAAIDAALQTASYTGNAGFYGTDTLTVTTTDGGGATSGAQQFAITVTDNAVITESLTGTLSGTEQAPITLAGLTVTDSNASDATLTTTLTVTDGLITVGDDGTPAATVTLTGTAAAIDAALQTASYTGNAGFYGTDTLTVTTTDGGGATSGAQQFAITVVTPEAPTEPFIWSSYSSSNWTDPSNWDNNGFYPGQYDHSDQVEIAVSGITVTINSDITVDSVFTVVGASLDLTTNGALTISGPDSSDLAGAIENNGTLDIETLSGTTLDGITVIDTGAIDVGVTTSGAILTLDDGTTVYGDDPGTLTIGSGGGSGTVDIEAGSNDPYGTNGPDATLDGVTVNNYGAIEVGKSITATLLLDDGTAVYGGNLTIGSSSEVEIENGSNDLGATLDDVSVQNSGNIQVDPSLSTVDLILADGTTVTGGALTIGSSGEVDIESGSNGPGATLDNVAVNNSGTLQVNPNATLTLADTVTLQDGGTVLMAAGSQIAEPSTNSGSIVTLDNVANTIEGAGTIGNHNDFLVLTNSGTVDANISGETLTIDTADNLGNSSTLTNTGTLGAENGGELSIHSIVDNTGGWVVASGGFVDFELGISGGSATVSDSGKLEYGWSSNVNTTFNGPGTLVLDHQNQMDSNFDTASYTGAISGFGAGDTLDVTDLGFSASDYALWTQTTTANGGSGTLAIYNSVGALEASFNLNGTYTQDEFALASDGAATNPGTNVNFNYISFSNGTINTNGNVTPVISNAGSTLELTDNNLSEAASWFATNKVAIGSFTASFDYQATPQGGGLADGIAFILQDDPRGSSALGGNGSSLGYGPAQDATGGAAISPSAAVEFNLYVATSPHVPGTSFATDGGYGSYNPTGNVDFADTGDEIQVVLNYNGALTETLTDLVNGNTFSTTYDNVDLAQILGSDTAYVGFSAATGGSESTQTVSNFTFTAEASPPPPPVDTWNGTGDWVFDTENWSAGFSPNAGDQALIASGQAQINSELTLDGNAIQNYAEIDVGVTSGAIVTLDDGTSIIGGTVVVGDGQSGTLDVEIGPNNITNPDSTLDGVTVYNNSGNIEVGESGPATLLLDDGTTVYGGGADGGTLTIGSTGEVDIETGANGPSYPDATLDGVTVFDNGAIDVGVTTSGAILVLDDGTTVYGNDPGTLTIDSSSEVDIESGSSGPGATLDGVIVNNYGAIEVGETSTATLLLDDNTTIYSSILSTGNYGTVDIEAGSNDLYGTNGPDATLDGVTVNNYYGTIEVGVTSYSGATLLLDDDTTIYGGTLSTGNYGTVDIEAGSNDLYGTNGPDATLDGVTVNNYYGTVEVGVTSYSAATLLLDDDTTIYGGTLSTGNYGTVDIEAGSNDPYGTNGPDATLDGVTVYDYSGTIEIGETTTATLLLDDGTTVYGGGQFGGTLTIGSTGGLDVETGLDGSGYGATLDGVNVIDNGAIDVGVTTSGAVLTLDDGTSLNGESLGTLFINSGSSAVFDDASVSATTITVGYEQPFSPLYGPTGVQGEGTFALGINDGGEIVGYFYDSSENPHGYILSDGVYTQLDEPSADTATGQGTYASGIANDGTVVGYYFGTDTAFHGFIEMPGNGSYASGTIVQLDDPSADDDYSGGTYATAINAGANEVAGYYYDDTGTAHGFVYDGSLTSIDGSAFATITELNVGYAGGTYVTGINDSGEIVGYYFDSNGVPHGFSATPDSGGNYNANAFTDLNDPFGVYGTYATGVNDAGEVVGYYYGADHELHGFLYEDGVYVSLSNPLADGGGTYATAINNSGQVVGYSNDDGFDGFAVATPTTLTLAEGAALSGDALAINAGSLVAIELFGIGATFDDVQVDNSGTIQVDGDVGAGVTLILSDGTGVAGGLLSIGSLGTLDVEGGDFSHEVLLDGVDVNNGGIIEIGASSIATLTLDDGTIIEGGLVTVNEGSTLDVEYGYTGTGASLDNVGVSGPGAILVDSLSNAGTDLLLSGNTTVTSTMLSIDNPGIVEIAADVVDGNYVSPTFTSLSVENSGTLQIDPNATLLIGGTVTLDGNGHGIVDLMTATEQFAAAIAGADSGTLDNVNNTIVADGYGISIGIGDGSLTFINELGGTVDADGNDVSVALNTGNTINNEGLLEATSGGLLQIDDKVINSGDGIIAINGGTVDLVNTNTSSDNVTFDGNGTLQLNSTFTTASYTGVVSGFGPGDAIVLTDLAYSSTETDSWNGTGSLTINNGTTTAAISVAGNYSQGNFALTADPSGGTAIIVSSGDRDVCQRPRPEHRQRR